MAIPKIIHYCWLSGDPYPDLIKKCIDSWRKVLPDYEIMLWDTNRFDINSCLYTKQAYEVRQWAQASDYIRLFALYNYGGIYLDCDIEVLKKFDDLLDNKAFTGFENKHGVSAWMFGSEKGNPLFKELLEYYDGKPYIDEKGQYDFTSNVIPVTNTLKKHGLVLDGTEQHLDYITIYPIDYFCPYSRATEELKITDNTYSIHYFDGAWAKDDRKQIIANRKKIIRKYGKTAGYVYYGFKILTVMGVKQFWKEFSFFAHKS